MVVAYSRYYARIWLEELTEIIRNHSQDSRCPDPGSNRAPPRPVYKVDNSNELESMWNEEALALFAVLSGCVHGETEENHTRTQSE